MCILLLLSRNCYYLVEQPAQSLLKYHKRWQYLANRIAWVPMLQFGVHRCHKSCLHSWSPLSFQHRLRGHKKGPSGLSASLGSPLVRTTLQVFEVFFWMQLHGSRSPKRTQFMGNVSTMGLLDKGRLSQKERKKRTTLRTTRSLSGDCALHTQMLLHAWHRSIDIYIYIY